MGEGRTSSAGLKQPSPDRAGLAHKTHVWKFPKVHAQIFAILISQFLFSRFCRGSRKSRKFGPRENFPLYGTCMVVVCASLPCSEPASGLLDSRCSSGLQLLLNACPPHHHGGKVRHHMMSHDITWHHAMPHIMMSLDTTHATCHMTPHNVTRHHMTPHNVTWHHMATFSWWLSPLYNTLPFYFQKLGFKGKVYATEPTMHFGR